MRVRLLLVRRLALGATVAALAGCDGGSGGSSTASAPPGGPPPPPMVDPNARPGGPPPPPVAAAPEKAQLRPVIGQTTDEVRDYNSEMQGGENVRAADTRITAKDPITLQGNAYVTIVGRAAVLQIEHAVNLFNATNDRYPADTEEFMREIIQANGIRLPQLPGYQDYAYKPDTHELIVLEYPDRKEALRPQLYGQKP